MKVLITGDRNLGQLAPVIERVIEELFEQYEYDLTIIHGACRGVDLYAEAVAKKLEINYRGFPAKWKKYGKPAGAIRNREMWTANPDTALVCAFHPDLSISRGTRDMVKFSMSQVCKIKIYNNEGFLKVINPQQIVLDI